MSITEILTNSLADLVEDMSLERATANESEAIKLDDSCEAFLALANELNSL